MKSFYRIAVFLPLMASSFWSLGQGATKKQASVTAKWFPKYDFNPAVFKQPAIEFGPFARWWWPGNNVDKTELQREINLFADNSFGGVEIQPMAALFAPGTAAARAKMVTWDTPDYYENLKTVMEEARKRGLTIDMTDGSGWPPGGSFLTAADGFLSLDAASIDVTGNSAVAIKLPTVTNNTTSPSRLETVMAAKILPKKEGDKSNTVLLDPSSVVMLTKYVHKDSLNWHAPAGDWKIVAFWSKPAGQKTMSASPTQGPVFDHFDSAKVLKNYRHLFGAQTGLAPYFGNPMRSVFNDSYEFTVNRHYALGFIAYFKKHRGYDITPWLPAEMQRGYNYVNYMNPNASPDFSFSSQDWRLKYDYDLTLSELFGEQFLKASRDFLEPQGLLHRTQAYGLNLDMMASAGLASIPETETMLGPEANIKIMTSGAHLYNRPIISAESVVYASRAYTTTPQKIKLAVDKLFAEGVNQVIYHGIPYRYTPEQVGSEGWYPFSLTTLGSINFSSNLGEGNIFWKDQKAVNQYIQRVQYALRSGKPHADVLIYFPFMSVDGTPENPEEIMTKGYIPGVEGPLPDIKERQMAEKEKWAEVVYPLINQLEANGITWDWVNDASIQIAQLNANKQINIRGNIYKALILANNPVTQLQTAQKISLLAARGMNLMATGTLPYMQPSYLNWQANDRKTEQFIQTALRAKSSKYIQTGIALSSWLKGVRGAVAFMGQYHFTRQVQRDMADGSRIQFIWNKSDQWQTLALSLDKKYLSSFWLNADAGTSVQNNTSVINYRLPPYGSIILFASTKKAIGAKSPGILSGATDEGTIVLALDKWDLKADTVTIENGGLFDWRTNDKLKFSSAEGIYSSSFQWGKSSATSHYYLDLGKVYFTAEVFVNGHVAGKRLFSPYMLDITAYLKQGGNSIEVRVTPGQLNGFIGKASSGDAHYKQFKGKEGQLMAAGLLGPVVIREQK